MPPVTRIVLFRSFQRSIPFYYIDFIVFRSRSQIPGDLKGVSPNIFQDPCQAASGALIHQGASEVTVRPSWLQAMSIPCTVTPHGSVTRRGPTFALQRLSGRPGCFAKASRLTGAP